MLLVALSLGRRASTHPDKTTDGAAGLMRADGLHAARWVVNADGKARSVGQRHGFLGLIHKGIVPVSGLCRPREKQFNRLQENR